MPAKTYRNLLKTIFILLMMMPLSFCAVAENNLKQEARTYREKGYEAQEIGDLDKAMTFYQKAVELDPLFAAAYNDLAVIYDIKGYIDRAEESYLRCLKLDPYFQSAYFNLANLYEEKGDLRKAAEYWKKRIEMGEPSDPWTQKAKARLENIGMLIEDIGREIKEQEKVRLLRSGPKERAEILFLKAEASYSKGNFAAALKDAATAQALDSSNSEIEKFVNKVRGKMVGAYSR